MLWCLLCCRTKCCMRWLWPGQSRWVWKPVNRYHQQNWINLCCGLTYFVYIAASFRSLCLGDAVLKLCKSFGIIVYNSNIGKTTLPFLDKIPHENVLYSDLCFCLSQNDGKSVTPPGSIGCLLCTGLEEPFRWRSMWTGVKSTGTQSSLWGAGQVQLHMRMVMFYT